MHNNAEIFTEVKRKSCYSSFKPQAAIILLSVLPQQISVLKVKFQILGRLERRWYRTYLECRLTCNNVIFEHKMAC